jgi:hypothetical protein
VRAAQPRRPLQPCRHLAPLNAVTPLLLAAALAALLLAAPGYAQELLRIRIANCASGEVAVSRDRGATWTAVGHVVRYTTRVNRNGYTASKWVLPGHVAATAVNAIHISAGYNAEDDRGVVFSLLPVEFLTGPANYASFLSPDSSIYTDLPAGRSIFGGGESPLVGSQVLLATAEGELPLPDGYVPAEGDVLLIVVTRTAPPVAEIVFENSFGGAVTLVSPDGSRRVVGWVVRPVRGVGRFLGGLYTDIGRIRANHTGVIDVATSPIGSLGGFQIIPYGHALSPEMGNAWKLTQWMIVEPVGDVPGLWGALTPLFCGHIRPDYLSQDLGAADWQKRLLSRFLVDVDTGNGWRPMPVRKLSPDPSAPLPEWANEALAEVKRIRIFVPQVERRSIDVPAAGGQSG